MTNIRSRWLCLPLALVMLAIEPAFAAGEAAKGPSEVIFIAQILALLIVGRLLGEAMLRLKQPAVMGQLIAGLLLGPSLFGLLLPDLQHALFPKNPEQKAMIDAISQLGILLLLLLTGMETDLKLVRQTGRAAVFASLMGIVVPFACGVALGEMLPDSLLPDPGKRLITALFLGTALSIASVKIVAMVVREMNFMRRVVGQVILASAIIDDSIGWIIVSIIFSLALHGAVDAWSLAQSVIGTLLFLAVSLTVGRRIVFFIIRWVNDTFVSDFAVVTAILVIMGGMSLITYGIGVHTVLGAFVAGILIGESPILTRHIDEQLRGLITAFFAPVFFGIAGLSSDLTILADPKIALLTVGLILIASIGKFGGAFIGAGLGGLTRREGFALACGMIILRYTVCGKHVYAIGESRETSRLSGINIDGCKIKVYIISGFLCAVSGILMTGRIDQGEPRAGDGYELDVIAAVVIGGTSLGGGKGTLFGTFIGVLILGLITNILNLYGIHPYQQMVVKGLVILGALMMQRGQRS